MKAKRMLAWLLCGALLTMGVPVSSAAEETAVESAPPVEATISQPAEEASAPSAAEEAPAEGAYSEEAGESPSEETPAEEIPAEESSVEESSVEETPAEETPLEESPAEEIPAEESPLEESPLEEIPAEESPAEEIPAEETPAEETPAEEIPSEESSVEETSAEEALSANAAVEAQPSALTMRIENLQWLPTIDGFCRVRFDASFVLPDGSVQTETFTFNGIRESLLEEMGADPERLCALLNGAPNEALVDAEKTAIKDREHCWSATASNMMVMSGWASQIDLDAIDPAVAAILNSGKPLEDGLMDYFVSRFNDMPAVGSGGLGWLFNGAAFFQRYAGWAHVSTIPSLSGGDPRKKDGLLREYCIDDVLESVDVKADAQSLNRLCEIFGGDGEDSGKVAAVSIYFYRDGARIGGHAVTVLGYGTDESGQICKLVVADSDDSVHWNADVADRAQYPNRIQTYPLRLEDGAWHIDGFFGAEYRVDAQIIELSMLNIYDAETTPRENGGSMNVVDDPDLRLDSAQMGQTHYAQGKGVDLCLNLWNTSYAAYSGPLDARCTIYCGDAIVFDEVLTVGAEMQIDAFAVVPGSLFIDAAALFKPGDYRVVLEMNPLVNGERKVAEAYYNNNTLRELLSFLIDPAQRQRMLRASGGTSAKLRILPENEGVYRLRSAARYLVRVENAPKRITAVCWNGAEVDAANYSIERNADGSWQIALNDDWLETLGAGEQTIELVIGKARCAFRIVLEADETSAA